MNRPMNRSTSRAPLPWDLPRRQALLDAVASLPEPPGGSLSPREALSHLAGAGLLRECVPAAHGGVAERVELRALCTIREALAYRDPLYDLMFAMQGLGSYPVTLAGTEAQRRALLPAIASGEAIGAFALTEPQAGSDLSMIATAARRAGDGHVLSGDKTFISNAGLASAYVLFARTGEDPGSGRARLSAFLVPADAPGLSITPMRLLCGDHPIGGLHLREVALPESARIGEEGGGMSLALRTLDHFRASVGAAAIGMARRALDEAVRRTRERVQFGKPLSAHQATQMALGEMAAALEGAALLVERAAYLVDARPGERATPHSAMAKLQATEVAQAVIDRALQLHGGSGLVEGCVTERLYREIRALRIYEGTSEIQKLVIAREILQGQGSRG